ncbi:A/G-specific adenine glycosylase [Novosphingobium sp. FSY-8]|uniref:Adenine DNA glycosylase n=1 Tax=Novosphingobium ovatum TaxID=1908523 RepID=A0ABW9XBG6_9SPHN|nr:A/G-specific adenine glycosylase [Novosphingobium ovatum]NBC35852.1 A/G-specific adenine glycosylase [Novosphingobium ovatum]
MDAIAHSALSHAASRGTIAADLLAWYDTHARALPWRVRPGGNAADPYRVWLSEVMLQQTTVAAVIPYFAAFTARWPTVADLAAAPEEDVMAAWAGLGYYSRARKLVECARAVAAMGGFPGTEAELRALPGLGPYTAAAVAAIAFGQRAVVVDANVERVVARLFAIDDPLPGGRAAIRAATDAITPDARCGDFAQGVMDLGASICRARDAQCLICPLSAHCAARVAGDPLTYPVKPAKVAKPERQGRAYALIRDAGAGAQVWLVRRAGKGLLGGMRALPDDGWTARADGSATPPMPGDWRAGGRLRHVFTHFALALELQVYLAPPSATPPSGEGEWWPLAQIEQAGLPTVFARAAALIPRAPD